MCDNNNNDKPVGPVKGEMIPFSQKNTKTLDNVQKAKEALKNAIENKKGSDGSDRG